MNHKQLIEEARSYLEPYLNRIMFPILTDLIERLTAALEKAEQENRWIPVGETLPEKDDKCLCRYVFDRHYDIPFYQVLTYYASDETPHFQHTLGDSKMEVTHWKPLDEYREPPKGD